MTRKARGRSSLGTVNSRVSKDRAAPEPRFADGVVDDDVEREEQRQQHTADAAQQTVAAGRARYAQQAQQKAPQNCGLDSDQLRRADAGRRRPSRPRSRASRSGLTAGEWRRRRPVGRGRVARARARASPHSDSRRQGARRRDSSRSTGPGAALAGPAARVRSRRAATAAPALGARSPSLTTATAVTAVPWPVRWAQG